MHVCRRIEAPTGQEKGPLWRSGHVSASPVDNSSSTIKIRNCQSAHEGWDSLPPAHSASQATLPHFSKINTETKLHCPTGIWAFLVLKLSVVASLERQR